MAFHHLTVRAHRNLSPLLDRVACAEMWTRLRSRFPRVLACVLMPNHIHLLVESHRLSKCIWEMGVELRAFSRRHLPGLRAWEPISHSPVEDSRQKIRSVVRYIHLNPCWAGLVGDPIEWEWSTHRDYLGATHPAWIDPSHFRRVWGSAPIELHRYVSSDPSVSITGTPFPVRKTSSRIAPIEEARSAILIATRRDSLDSAGLRLLALLSEQVCKVTRKELADAMGIHPRSAFKLLEAGTIQVDKEAVRAAMTVLSDPRFLNQRMKRAWKPAL